MELQLFDFDGTIADTSFALFKAYKEAFAEQGIFLPLVVWELFKGQHIREICKHFHVEEMTEKIRSRKYELYPQEYMRDIKLINFTGVFYSRPARDVINVICSTTEYAVMQPILDNFNINCFFSDVFDSHDVKNTKPDPEVFIKAVESISKRGRMIDKITIFEDSTVGIEAAKKFREKYPCKIWRVDGNDGHEC